MSASQETYLESCPEYGVQEKYMSKGWGSHILGCLTEGVIIIFFVRNTGYSLDSRRRNEDEREQK